MKTALVEWSDREQEASIVSGFFSPLLGSSSLAHHHPLFILAISGISEIQCKYACQLSCQHPDCKVRDRNVLNMKPHTTKARREVYKLNLPLQPKMRFSNVFPSTHGG